MSPDGVDSRPSRDIEDSVCRRRGPIRLPVASQTVGRDILNRTVVLTSVRTALQGLEGQHSQVQLLHGADFRGFVIAGRGYLQDRVLMPSLTAEVFPSLSSWTKIVCAAAREALARIVKSLMMNLRRLLGSSARDFVSVARQEGLLS